VSDEVYDVAAGDQFVVDVFGCGVGALDGGGRGVGGAGLGVGVGGVVVLVGDVWVGGAGVAGSGVAGDDGGGDAVFGVAESGGGACGAGAAGQARAVVSAFEAAQAATVLCFPRDRGVVEGFLSRFWLLTVFPDLVVDGR